jgi:hypothetical protein
MFYYFGNRTLDNLNDSTRACYQELVTNIQTWDLLLGRPTHRSKLLVDEDVRLANIKGTCCKALLCQRSGRRATVCSLSHCQCVVCHTASVVMLLHFAAVFLDGMRAVKVLREHNIEHGVRSIEVPPGT